MSSEIFAPKRSEPNDGGGRVLNDFLERVRNLQRDLDQQTVEVNNLERRVLTKMGFEERQLGEAEYWAVLRNLLELVRREIARMQPADIQVIIATSAAVNVTKERLTNLPHKLLEYGDKVIRPLQD